MLHCPALLSAAFGANLGIINFFLESGFEVNSLYDMDTPNGKCTPGAFVIQVSTASPCAKGGTAKGNSKNIISTIEFLLNNGADINTADSKRRTALSIAMELGDFELVRTLFNRDADPLVSLESHRSTSGIEQLVQLVERSEYGVSFMDMLRDFLELMAAKDIRVMISSVL